MNKPFLAGTAALLAVAGGAYYVLKPSGAPQDVAEAPPADPGALSAEQVRTLGIRTEAAVQADAVPLGTVPGQVSLPPDARVAVTTPFAGTVTQVLVLQGQQVSRGQPLAIIRAAEPVRFSADLSRAQADLAVDRARAQRLEALAREGIVAGARADEATALLRRAEASVAENHRLLSLAGAGRDGTVTLRAPITGRVASVSIETGGPTGDGMAPFVIENTATLTLDLQLPERLAGQVRPGMNVSVPRSRDGSVSGTIVSVAASIDPATRSVAAKARLSSAGELVPGRGVMAIISSETGKAQSGVSVPSQAVIRLGDNDVVFARERGRFVKRPVTVVADAGGRAILTSGLRIGEQVAVSGVAELKSLLAEQ